jgi:AraC-like DNA-binding protein
VAISSSGAGERAASWAEPGRRGALRAVPDTRAERDRKIVELREAGWRAVEIAPEVGITSEYVARILRSAGGVDRERWLKARSELHLRRATERSDEILARFRAGERPPEIANELGLNQQAVWRIVRELSTDADRSARARVLADRHRPRFSDSELLDGLTEVALRLGWVPSDTEYDRLARGMRLATSATIYQRFDGWQIALAAAGLEAQPQRRWSRWDAAACWRALESVADQLGDPPRYRRYQQLARERDDLPFGGVVRSRLGLWSQIAAELGRRGLGGQNGSAPARRAADAPARRVSAIRPRVNLPSRTESGVAGRRARSFSDEQLLAGVRAVGEAVGRTPTCGEYNRLAEELGLACLATVEIRFGKWSGALAAAGFEPAAPVRSYRRKWDAQACWGALERVADELGDWPRYRHYEQLAAGREDLPSAAMLRQRLGTWSQIAAALRERRGAAEAGRRVQASAGSQQPPGPAPSSHFGEVAA